MRVLPALLLAGLAALPPLSCVGKRAGQPAELYVEVGAPQGLRSFDEHRRGLAQAAEELGVRTEARGPQGPDAAAMAAAVDQAVAAGVSGLLVVGWEESLGAAVDRAVAAGVPVVTVDLDLPGSARLAFVGTDNYRAGLRLGGWVLRRLGNRGTAALLGATSRPEVRERMNGVKAAFQASGAEVVQVRDTGGGADGAELAAAGLLQEHPELDALLGLDAEAGLGIGRALQDAGTRVLATGFDRDDALLRLVEEGVLGATVVQRTALMPYYGVLLLRQLRDSRLTLTADDGAAAVRNLPELVDTGVLIVEAGQAGAFRSGE